MADIFDIFKKLESQKPSAQGPVTHLVVGLGNPGKEYRLTRHNAGFLCMDTVCEKYGAVTDRSKYKALVGEATVAGRRVLLMRPQTFMNASGEAVVAAANFYHIEPANIIVISDDVNLAVGGLRVRGKGSDGGQKGLRSIITELGRDDFPRIRIGVGQKPRPEYDMADWVLSTFAPSELEKLRTTFPIACDGLEHLLRGNLDAAMQVCNRKG